MKTIFNFKGGKNTPPHLLILLVLILFSFNTMAQNHLSGFIANGGQFRDSNDSVRTDLLYTTHIQGAKVYITKKGLHFVYLKVAADSTKKDSTYRMDVEFNLANTSLVVNATDQKTSYNNYFYKNNSYPNVKEYGKLTFVNVWPNINLELTSDTAGLKFKYNLAVNANPQNIQLKFVGGRNLALTSGNLNITSAFGDPLGFLKHTITLNGASKGSVAAVSSTLVGSIWQINTSGTNTNSSYAIENKIDDKGPTPPIPAIMDNVKWATYYGGSALDIITDVFTTLNNQIIICGYTGSSDFPKTVNIVQSQLFSGDAFVSKFRADRSLDFSTYFGGNGNDRALSVTKNSRDEIIFCGSTSSLDFPRQPNYNALFQPANAGIEDGFITKLSPDGQYKLWSTYFGGNGIDACNSISIGSNDKIYITGSTTSSNLPLKNFLNGFNQSYSQCLNIESNRNGFIIQTDARDSLIWSTYYGGRSDDYFNSSVVNYNNQLIILGSTNSSGISGSCGIYNSPMPVCGPAGSYFQNYAGSNSTNYDCYLAKFNTQNQVYWASCYGGLNGNEQSFELGAKAISLLANDDIIFTASTNGNLPMLNYGNNQFTYGLGRDAFIVRFGSNGIRKWSTYIGGSGLEYGTGIARLNNGGYMVVGISSSTNFPHINAGLPNYFDSSMNGVTDGFQVIYSYINDKIHSSFVGGNFRDHFYSVSSSNDGLYIASVGETNGDFFPVRDLPGTLDYFDDSYNLGKDGFIFNQNFPCSGNTCRVALNINETQINKGFNIFPNPSSDIVNVQFDIVSNNQFIEVYNMAGQLLEKINVNAEQTSIQLDFSSYNKGIYLIKLQNSDSVFTKSIVIQ